MVSFNFNNKKQEVDTFQELANKYISYLESNNSSPYSISSYKFKIKKLQEFFILNNIESLSEIDEELINDYKKNLLKTNRASSVNSHLTHIKSLFNFGFRKGYLEKFEIKFIKAEQKVKKVYSKEDLEIILCEKPRETFIQRECRVICSVFVATGLRLSELISLQVRDIDLESDILYTRHTKTKVQRVLPITNNLKKILQEWLRTRKADNEEENLFCNSYGEDLCVNTLRTMLRRYFKKWGIEDTGIHQFRRTYITHAIDKGVDVISLSRLTGHKRLQNLSIYYVSNVEMKRQLQNKVDILEDLKDRPIRRKRLRI